MKVTPKGQRAAVLHEDEDEDGEKPVAAIVRSTQVLDAFLNARGTLTLAELSAATGLYKSTIARILHTLELHEYVVRTRNGDHHIGPALLRLARCYQHAVQSEVPVLPVLRKLVAETGESASYVIRHEEQQKLVLYRVNSPHPLRDHGLAGDVSPQERGAAGHVFRAFQGRSARDIAIRERLMAVSQGEIEIGMTGMASPVFNSSRECAAVVAISGPVSRFTPDAMQRWEVNLMEAAAELTQRLGGTSRVFEGPLSARKAAT